MFSMKLIHGHGHILSINRCFLDCGTPPEFRPPDLELYHKSTHLHPPSACEILGQFPPELPSVDTCYSIQGYRIILPFWSTPKKYQRQAHYFHCNRLSAPYPDTNKKLLQICYFSTCILHICPLTTAGQIREEQKKTSQIQQENRHIARGTILANCQEVHHPTSIRNS